MQSQIVMCDDENEKKNYQYGIMKYLFLVRV